MAKSKSISSYPAQYFKLFECAEANPTFTFGPMSKASAHNLRFDLYAFRKALDHEGHPAARAYSRFKIKIASTEDEYILQFNDPTAEFANLFDALPEFETPELEVETALETDEDAMSNILGSLGFESKES